MEFESGNLPSMELVSESCILLYTGLEINISGQWPIGPPVRKSGGPAKFLVGRM